MCVYVCVCVCLEKVRDKDDNEFTFMVKQTIPFRKVFDAFCAKLQTSRRYYRFLFDDRRIDVNDTPEGLLLEDGDVIDAVVEVTGG